jgi:cellulose synthase (UDP-forming)
MISEIGAEVALTQPGFPTVAEGDALGVELEILEQGLAIAGEAVRTDWQGEFPTVRIMFESLTLEQQRSLVALLFCRPGQWQKRQTPGEWQSLLILFRVLLRPKVLFDRNADVNAVSVAQL